MIEGLHVAIIMDGSGRWAKKRGLPRVFGHRQGAESIRVVVNTSPDLGVKYVTLFTFSTENWQRPKDEVDYLMSMLEEMLYKETPGLHKEDVRINAIGRIGDLYEPARKALGKAMETTQNNSGLVLTFCLSYGGRGEIVDAVKKIILKDRKNRIDLDAFGEDDLNRFLYDPTLPAPDLLIRTGADNRTRISNFLLWEIAYAELYFTKTLWPDFRKKEYAKAIDDFRTRERLFGKIE
jgi:undecaprenyl diphosphate synthase